MSTVFFHSVLILFSEAIEEVTLAHSVVYGTSGASAENNDEWRGLFLTDLSTHHFLRPDILESGQWRLRLQCLLIFLVTTVKYLDLPQILQYNVKLVCLYHRLLCLCAVFFVVSVSYQKHKG